jgi:hypothetical protein
MRESVRAATGSVGEITLLAKKKSQSSKEREKKKEREQRCSLGE